ncbi:MAG: TolC family protein [Spirochaetaceae bacterium]
MTALSIGKYLFSARAPGAGRGMPLFMLKDFMWKLFLVPFLVPFLVLLCTLPCPLPTVAAEGPAGSDLRNTGGEHSAYSEIHTISFEEAKELILSASSELGFARSALRVTSSHISPFITDRLPSLSFSYSSRDEYEAGIPASPRHSMSVGAEMVLIDGGRTQLKSRLRDLGISEARLELRKVEKALAESAAKIFSSILIAKEQLSLLESSYLSAFRHLGSARKRLSQGKITRDELSKISLKVRELGLSLRKAELSLLEHRNSLLSLSGGVSAIPQGTINADYHPLISTSELSVGELSEHAQITSPDSVESSISLERAELAAAGERRSFLPSLSLFSSITFTGSKFPPVTPEVTLGFTILSRGESGSISYTGSAVSHHYGGGGRDSLSVGFPLYRSQETRQLRELELAAQRRENSKLQQNLEHLIEERYRKTRLIESERDILKTSIALREREYGTVELRYRKGHAPLGELLDSRRELTALRIELLKTAASLFLSEYGLLLFCGMERRADRCAEEFFRPPGKTEKPEKENTHKKYTQGEDN